jgi:hypothetical protein
MYPYNTRGRRRRACAIPLSLNGLERAVRPTPAFFSLTLARRRLLPIYLRDRCAYRRAGTQHALPVYYFWLLKYFYVVALTKG